MVSPSIEVYLSEEEPSLSFTRLCLDRYGENVEALLQLIEKFEEPGASTAGRLQKDPGSQGQRTEVGMVQPTGNNGPTKEDIKILKKHLEDEEGCVRVFSKIARDEESRIASYRRLITASSS